MARKKNSTFQGVSVYDTDIDSPSFRRAVENVAGDLALIYDKLTGENAEANTITHVGSGRGAPLGIPLVNQWIGRSLNITNPSGKDTSGGTGDTMILPYILRIPPGETDLVVRVYIDGSMESLREAQPRVVVTNTGLTQSHDVPMSLMYVNGTSVVQMTANLTGLTAEPSIVSVRMSTDLITTIGGDGYIGELLSCSMYRPGRRPGGTISQDSDTNQVTVTTPSATEGVAMTTFDATMFVGTNILDPIDGWTTSKLNQSINGLFEYGSGLPAAGNATYTHVDHDGAGVADDADPARSRFFAHTQSLYANEPAPIFPLAAVSFGAFNSAGYFVVDAVEPPTIGMLEWYAPWPTVTSKIILGTIPVQFPDFISSPSGLTVVVLLGSESAATAASWTCYASTTAGEASGAATSCSAANDLWFAIFNAVPFTGDANDYINIALSKSAAKTGVNEVCLLAAAAYFEP